MNAWSPNSVISPNEITLSGYGRYICDLQFEIKRRNKAFSLLIADSIWTVKDYEAVPQNTGVLWRILASTGNTVAMLSLHQTTLLELRWLKMIIFEPLASYALELGSDSRFTGDNTDIHYREYSTPVTLQRAKATVQHILALHYSLKIGILKARYAGQKQHSNSWPTFQWGERCCLNWSDIRARTAPWFMMMQCIASSYDVGQVLRK